jgi:hypothetical protein
MWHGTKCSSEENDRRKWRNPTPAGILITAYFILHPHQCIVRRHEWFYRFRLHYSLFLQLVGRTLLTLNTSVYQVSNSDAFMDLISATVKSYNVDLTRDTSMVMATVFLLSFVELSRGNHDSATTTRFSSSSSTSTLYDETILDHTSLSTSHD